MLYNFVGQPRKLSGLAGLDVTGKLEAIRTRYVEEWGSLTPERKRRVASALASYNPFGTALNSWDIFEFANSKGESNVFTNGNASGYCPETVTVSGRGYFQDEVNYFLWGLANRLAYEDGLGDFSHSLNLIKDKVIAYRHGMYPWEALSGHIDARLGWTPEIHAHHAGQMLSFSDRHGILCPDHFQVWRKIKA